MTNPGDTESIYVPAQTPPQQFGHPSTWQGTTPQPAYAAPPTPPPARKQTSRIAVLVIVGVVVAVMVGLLVGVRLYNDSRRGDPGAVNSAQLIATCHEGVKARLKAPSTAQFSQESIAGMTETRWKVSGVVDAQNGFGAMLRQRYSCQADKDGAGKWTVYNVAFTDW